MTSPATAPAHYIVVMPAPTSCTACDFSWDEITRHNFAARLSVENEALVAALSSAGARATRRPSPARWSVLEYAAHVRDVLISIRERVILAVVLERPTGVAMYRDERVDAGLYRNDTSGDVAEELQVLARLVIATVSSLGDGVQDRTLVFSPQSPHEVTIGWAIAQLVHEVRHHLMDVRENLTLLGDAP